MLGYISKAIVHLKVKSVIYVENQDTIKKKEGKTVRRV